jgi:heme A synthase
MQRALPITAAATVGVTLILMTLGGVVHAAGASLACPDWPLCHGQVFPAMVGGVALEHSHRILGAVVACLAVATAVMAWRSPKADATDERLAWAGVALVLVQATLGGATVLVQLSPVLSTLHLAVAMIFLAVQVTLAMRLRPRWHGEVPVIGRSPLRTWAAMALGVLFVQMVLGGVVRHSHASMACGADPWLCGGALWPEATLARLHMTHRLLAVAVTLLVFGVAARAAKEARPEVRALGATAVALVAVQVVLGLASVVGVLPVAIVAAHLAVAALLWITLLAVWMRPEGFAWRTAREHRVDVGGDRMASPAR